MFESNEVRRSDGRQSALEQFYVKYKSVLHKYFLRKVRSHAEADDLTQDLLVRMAQHMDRTDIENPDVFVFTVAANLIRDRNRKLSRHYRNTEDFEKSVQTVEVLSPERVLLDKQALEVMLKHLKGLAAVNPRASEIFALHRIEGLRHAEIAQIYGIATSTVEKDIMRAMAYLAKCAYDSRD